MRREDLRSVSRRDAGGACLWCVVALLLAFAGRANAADGPVTITFRTPSRTISDVVRIGDVADLTGGTESLRTRIAELDLDDAPQAGVTPNVTAQQVMFRLRLAGIDPRAVSIRGTTNASSSKSRDPRVPVKLASQSRTQPDVASTEQAVLAAAVVCLKKQLPWSDESLDVQLAQPLPRELQDAPASAVYLAEWRAAGTPQGRVALRIVRQVAGQKGLDVPVQFDVRHFEEIIVTTRPIARGELIVAADLEIARRDVTQQVGYCTTSDSLVGRKAKRILPAGYVLKAADVETPLRTSEPPLVKRRDRVKVLARSGALVIEMSGEAQQEGRAGDVIKVRNISSNAVISARVLTAGEVEVVE